MTWLEALKATVETQLDQPVKFIHADLFKANFGVDELEDKDFPVFVFIAPLTIQNTVNQAGFITRRVPISGFFLTKYEQDTIDYKTAEVEPTIQAMRDLGDKLVHQLNQALVTNPETDGIVNFSTESTYAKNDAHLFGCEFEAEWPVNELTKGC
jgi:hypothetical protein